MHSVWPTRWNLALDSLYCRESVSFLYVGNVYTIFWVNTNFLAGNCTHIHTHTCARTQKRERGRGGIDLNDITWLVLVLGELTLESGRGRVFLPSTFWAVGAVLRGRKGTRGSAVLRFVPYWSATHPRGKPSFLPRITFCGFGDLFSLLTCQCPWVFLFI